jgi:hypothetical protein
MIVTGDFSNFIILQLELKNRIASLLKESRHFNSNDVLVHVDSQNKKLFKDMNVQLNYSFGEFPSNIIKETQQTLKETGVNALCFTYGCLQIELSNKMVQSPFLLVPVEVKKDRIKKRWLFEMDYDSSFINPFVVDYLTSIGVNIETNHFLENEKFNYDKFNAAAVEWGLSTYNDPCRLGII